MKWKWNDCESILIEADHWLNLSRRKHEMNYVARQKAKIKIGDHSNYPVAKIHSRKFKWGSAHWSWHRKLENWMDGKYVKPKKRAFRGDRKFPWKMKFVHMYTSPALPVTHGKQDGSASRYGRNSLIMQIVQKCQNWRHAKMYNWKMSKSTAGK